MTYFNSAHDNEYNDTQVLLISISTAKLSPLLKHNKFSRKIHFYIKPSFVSTEYIGL